MGHDELQPMFADVLPPAPERPDAAHKGTFGTVIVIGGSRTMIGAPALCARAALRGGAGLVKIATLPAVLPHALTIEPGATGIALNFEHDPASCAAMLDDADPKATAVLAVGPGWGASSEAGELLGLLLAGSRAMVLDADGLNLLARRLRQQDTGLRGSDGAGPRVLTPHPGEFARLTEAIDLEADAVDEGHRPGAAAALHTKLGLRRGLDIVLLKGRHTVVCDGQHVYVNQTGNAALATAGSGDVLTGLIAALLAQGMAGFEAAALGAHLHGLTADQWAQRHGPSGLRAMELADELPAAFEARRRQ